ncbi:uncharacterized protein LOC117176280 isoform X2 [Belonocnema kinseyi]|uniref:uncharacterized protein LOC117176280 isoform X2 n=1 Tax=Belonocnema kinseyi TaxID=2817044 RepID=UPI00143CC93B|nr:uncharacterized protein LOC117176280 isoform X2 [Belonocnema kinseyi]
MKRFIILVCLVAAEFAHGADVQTIRQLSPHSVQLKLKKLPGELTKCVVTTNTGKEVSIFPENENEDNVSNYILADSNECQPVIANTDYHMNGLWTVKQTYTDQTVTEEFNLKIKDMQELSEVIPANSVTVYEGNYAILKLAEKFHTLESCSLSNSKIEIDLFSEEYSYLRIQEPGVCGIRMLASENSSGTWYLYADVRSNETYYGSFTINIASHDEEDIKPVVYFQLGESAQLTFSQRSARLTYCQMQDPTGKKWNIESGSCIHKIPFVTKLHEGVWQIHYGIRESNTPMKAEITVLTFDSAPLNATVIYAQNEQINLLCSVRGGYEVKYCQFTRPDGITFGVTPGVGNERYEYYGQGFARRSMIYEGISDCGLTIRSPSAEDFGAWKCKIQIDGKTTGTILRTDHLSRMFVTKDVKTSGSKVYVKRGNQFTIKCSANAVLNYCWMLSPNGTVYSVSEKESSPSHLTYKGSGFEMGECGAIVTVADDTHLGEWSCRMGVLNGTEVEASVSVTVTDSFLIPDENTIDISYKKPTILTCRILPGYEAAISYCRWIRPDGHGIYNNVDNQYVTEGTLSCCKLTILELNVGYDIGSWSCVAGIAGPKNIEAISRIHINYSYIGLGGFVAVVLTIALLIITTIILFVIIVRKRRIRYPDEKVIIYK